MHPWKKEKIVKEKANKKGNGPATTKEPGRKLPTSGKGRRAPDKGLFEEQGTGKEAPRANRGAQSSGGNARTPQG